MSASKIERGDIFYISQNGPVFGSEQMAGRPAIIVSNDKNNAHSETVEVVYLTTQEKAPLPTHVPIRSAPRPSIALCEQITTVSITRIGNYAGHVTDREMTNIEIAMLISLDLSVGETKEKIVEVPVERVKEVDREVQAPIEAKLAEDLANASKIAAERDTYKSMYESLLDRLIKAG